MPNELAQTLQEWTFLMMRRYMHNYLIYAKEHNYSLAQLNAMQGIHHKGWCGVSDLGERMGVTSAAASQLLDRIVQQGLAIRAEDPQDRRNKRISLTKEGERIIQESMEARQGWLKELAAKLSPAEAEQVEAALRLLITKAALLDETTPELHPQA